MIKNIQKLLFNFINSINGFKIVLKEHSFKAEIIVLYGVKILQRMLKKI